jgi:sugar phosphate isomerase/epimerase
VRDRWVLHIDECVPGEGLLDLSHFLRLFDAAAPEGYALIEHLPEADIPRAKRALDAAAARAGLSWRE